MICLQSKSMYAHHVCAKPHKCLLTASGIFYSKFHTVYSVMNGLQMKMQCTLFDVVEYLQAMHEPYSSMPTKLIDFYKYI